MSTPRIVFVVLALLSAACSAKAAGPPAIEVDRTACSHCGMFVSEPVYAAAYQVHGQEPRVFDDVGCMLDAVRRERVAPIDIWVQDAAGAGWLNADEATFVASAEIRTPMNGGVLAYNDAATAEKAAMVHRGRVMRSLQELIAWRGDPE